MASYKGVPGKSCKFGNFEATAVSEQVFSVVFLDTPFTLSNEQVGQLLEVLGAVTEWRPGEEH